MANITARGAHAIRGGDPQTVLPLIVRSKIYESSYWKTHCLALNAAGVVAVATRGPSALQAVSYCCGGARLPSPFACLLLKLLQLQPELDVLHAMLSSQAHKYLRILCAFYVRLTQRAVDVYMWLEPLLADARRVRVQQPDTGAYKLQSIDEVIELLLTGDTILDLHLPHISKRSALEAAHKIPHRNSILSEEIHLQVQQQKQLQEKQQQQQQRTADVHKRSHPSASRSPDQRGQQQRREEGEHDRNGERSTSSRGDRRRSSRSRSRDRDRHCYPVHRRPDSRDRSRSRSSERTSYPPRSYEQSNRRHFDDREDSRSHRYRSRSRSPASYRHDRSRSRKRGRERDRNRDRDHDRGRDRDSSHWRG